MQAKDIPEVPILSFIAVHGGIGCNWFGVKGEYERSVINAMPDGVNGKLALAKIKQLKKRGLISGCPCGCRGDFELTEKGRALVESGSGAV